jgi:hypothetical protein
MMVLGESPVGDRAETARVARMAKVGTIEGKKD